MSSARRAVIDVGTNSIKLLVAEVADRQVRPLLEESRQTRLGKDFYQTHRLQAGPVARTAEAVAEFATRAREQGVDGIRVIATSAARDASNADMLSAAIERASGLKLEIISGEQEAEWAFQGATTNPELAREPLLLLEVGGGSSQFILGHADRTDFRYSFPLGTVRLLETLRPGDPPQPAELAACRAWLAEFFQKEIEPRLGPALRRESKYGLAQQPIRVVGTGGTATILGCMEAELRTFDRERLEAVHLRRERLSELVERLWGMPLEKRQQIAGLPKNRADVILPGAAIYETVLARLGFAELRISTRGLRFAAVMHASYPRTIS